MIESEESKDPEESNKPDWKNCPEVQACQLINDLRRLIFSVAPHGYERYSYVLSFAKTLLGTLFYSYSSYMVKEETVDELIRSLKEDLQTTNEHLEYVFKGGSKGASANKK